MKQLKVKEMTPENFGKYGSYADMLNPGTCKIGEEPVEFYRDMVLLGLGQANVAAFSVCRVLKRPNVIDNIEYHNHTGEGMMPLDGDVYLCFAPATANGDVPYDRLEVFRAPKGRMVMIRPGVWHCAAYICGTDCVNVLIVLPERVYAKDCIVVKIPEEKHMQIKE